LVFADAGGAKLDRGRAKAGGENMALVFARNKTLSGGRPRKSSARRIAAQASLWEPTVVGRSFAQAAMTFRSSEQVLKARLKELELRRRRAQIKARRSLQAAEEPAALPFAS
jgi:hypothetical protein